MVEEILPIGSFLSKLSVRICGNEADFNLIVLTFKPTHYLVLQPLANTNQISISPRLSYERKRVIRLLTNPQWAQPLIGKKLTSAWTDKDEKGDRQQIVFAFDNQILSFWAKNSVFKVSLHKKIQPKKVSIKQKIKVGFNKICLNKKNISILS